MAKGLLAVSILLVGMLVIAHGARELQQVVRSGSQTGQTFGAQSTPVTTLNGGGGGGNGGGGGGGNSGNSGNAAGPASGPSSGDNSDSGSANASNNAAGRTPATLIHKDLGSSNVGFIGSG